MKISNIRFLSCDTGGLDIESLLWYKANHDLGEAFFEMFESYSALASKSRNDHIDVELKNPMHEMQQRIIENTTDTFSSEEGMLWVDNMTLYIDQLNDAILDLADFITLVNRDKICSF